MYIEQGCVLNKKIPAESGESVLSGMESGFPPDNAFSDLLLPLKRNSYFIEQQEQEPDKSTVDALVAQLSAGFLIPPPHSTDELPLEIVSNEASERLDIRTDEVAQSAESPVPFFTRPAPIEWSIEPFIEKKTMEQEVQESQPLVSDPFKKASPMELFSAKSLALSLESDLPEEKEDRLDATEYALIPQARPLTDNSVITAKPRENSVESISMPLSDEHKKNSAVTSENAVDFLVNSMNSNGDAVSTIRNTFEQQPSLNTFIPLTKITIKPVLPESVGNISVETEVLDKSLTNKITLHVNQEALGQITAKIEMVNKQSVVSFVTETAEAKTVLTHHVQQLQEIFNASDLTLNQTHIEQQLPGNGRQQEKHAQHPWPSSESVKERHPVAQEKIAQRMDSLLDTFA